LRTGKEVICLQRRKAGFAVSILLLVLVAAALTAPGVWGAPVPSQTSIGSAEPIDAKAIAAERELVTGKLMDFGLSEKDASSRVSLLTDQEVHTLASDLESLQAAGDDFEWKWNTTTVLLSLILFVLIVD
jgi:hypothetical protein